MSSFSVRFSNLPPVEQFKYISLDAKIERTGFRATLGQTCLGLLILEIFNIFCCCLCHDPVENELKSYRVILLQNRRYKGDDDYDDWVSAVRRVNGFTLFNRIDTILTRHVIVNHQPRYPSPGHHTTILNTNPSYIPMSTYSQPLNSRNSVQLNASPSFNSMPTGHNSVYGNNNSSFSGSTLGHNQPNSASLNTSSTFQVPSFYSVNNRPTSVPPGTKRR
jgi:hypothetical protein